MERINYESPEKEEFGIQKEEKKEKKGQDDQNPNKKELSDNMNS